MDVCSCCAAMQLAAACQELLKGSLLQPEDSSSGKERQLEKGDGGRIVLYLKDTVSQQKLE